MKKTLVLMIFLLSFCSLLFAEDAFRYLVKANDYHEISVKRERKIELPSSGWHEGLYIDDDQIWVNNGKGFNTDVLDIRTGKQTGQIIVPGTFMEGISKLPNGKYIWSDWYDRAFFFGELIDRELVIKARISVGDLFPAGIIAADDDIFVIGWERALDTKYYLLKFDKKGMLIEKTGIKDIQEPSQLAWDGKYLWISSWNSEKVYKVDISDYSLKGFFKTNIDRTTGIVWDGNGFWVTGTTEDIYVFKISKNPLMS
ncbi:MAG: hypothetical protein PHQ52_04825 [Candidatus Omnitrophica bacterium]|nr:hypothetical protein [Candidatus Omnitrophota bacterium]